MKKYIVKGLMIIAVVLSFSFTADAQIVVKIRPVAPVVRVRPVMPAPGHIWVGGNYTWRGGQYVYTDGYWARPPQHRRYWVDGRWKHRRGGWVWVPGYWR